MKHKRYVTAKATNDNRYAKKAKSNVTVQRNVTGTLAPCAQCGEMYTAKRLHNGKPGYCSDACKMKAYRLRTKSKVTA